MENAALNELLKLCKIVNDNTKSDVFFNYSPFATEVRFYENGFDVEKEPTYFTAYLEEETETMYQSAKSALMQLLGDKRCIQ